MQKRRLVGVGLQKAFDAEIQVVLDFNIVGSLTDE